jgi:membrane fusion protein, multidrug efflux system
LNSPRIPLVALAIVVLLAAGCGSKSESGAPAAGGKPGDAKDAKAGGGGPGAGGGDKPKGLPVKAVQVSMGEILQEVTAVGSLIADESVMIRPEIDGRLVGIHFEEGQTIAKGARLVTLDPAELQAQLAQAQAQARTELQRYERAKELLAQQFVSREAVDLAKNNLDRADALRREAEARLSKTEIRAPFSGTVGLRSVSPGAYVKKGDDIARLENLGAIKVDFRVPEGYVSKLHAGQEIAVRLDAFPGEAFTGRIFAVEPVVDERTRTIVLRGRIRNDNMKLKPGMFVRVALVTDKRQNAITVPEQAIWPIGQENFVYRVQDGKAVQTKIAITSRRPGSVEIGTGLSAGDVVVTEGQMKLKDGAPVMVLPAAPPAPSAAADAPQKKGS